VEEAVAMGEREAGVHGAQLRAFLAG